MNHRNYLSSTRDKIVAALKRHGPMTPNQIAEKAKLTISAVDGAINNSRKTYGTEHFRVVGWGTRTPKAKHDPVIYGLGPNRDVTREEWEAARREPLDPTLNAFERIFGKRVAA